MRYHRRPNLYNAERLQFRRWQYGSIFVRLAVIGSQICEISQNSERIRTYSGSRSSKVIDIGVNRKGICDFLLVVNIVTSDVSHTVCKILTFKATKWLVSPPLPCLSPPLGDSVRISGWKLPRKNWRDGTTVCWKFHDANFNRFWLIHPCVRRTQRWTDGW